MKKKSKIQDFSKRRDLPVCPECGKHGEKRAYRNGDVAFNHIQKLTAFPFWHVDILEQCYIPGREVAKK